MKIKYFEQSGFIIEANSGSTLAVDIGYYTPLENLAGISPDAMLISHFHGDHFSPEHIAKLAPQQLYVSHECLDTAGDKHFSSTTTITKAGDQFTVNDFTISVFSVDHGPNVSQQPKENFGFMIEVDGQRVYFAGDIFYPSGIPVADLEVDIALIPVGTFYTFGPKEAVAFAQSFKRIGKVVPIHYENNPETKDEFITLAKAAGLEV
jgi:L-ascorbate metabolism protein UlaG (beta-lactamase superfamily)